ncbi:DUF1534 domain-containing protein [Pseudomonas syringae]|nr:DUF1534 domain-containing protein [Pseudomonas syringae]
MGVQLSGGSPQRGNAFRDAPRHNSVPHCTFKSERGTSASYMHLRSNRRTKYSFQEQVSFGDDCLATSA